MKNIHNIKPSSELTNKWKKLGFLDIENIDKDKLAYLFEVTIYYILGEKYNYNITIQDIRGHISILSVIARIQREKPIIDYHELIKIINVFKDFLIEYPLLVKDNDVDFESEGVAIFSDFYIKEYNND